MISQYKDKLLTEKTVQGKKRSHATVVRYLAILSHLFTIASKEWGWATDNPVLLISKTREAKGRVRFLDEAERQALLKSCEESKNSNLYIIVILALSTGMRLGEILNLTWDRVDVQKGRIILEETKNGERRQVPLAGKALEIIKRHEIKRIICSKFLFPDTKTYKKPTDIRSAWNAALKRSGIKNFRFHDLRHCCASYLAMNGCSIVEIAGVLGHKTLQMAKRYSHLSDSHLSDAVSRMNEKILA